MLLKESLDPFDKRLHIVYDPLEKKYLIAEEDELRTKDFQEKISNAPKLQVSEFRTLIGVLHITTHCNLACKYCYNLVHNEDPAKGVFRSSESTLRVIRKLQQLAEERKRRLHIEFHGGEPLIKWSIIREVIPRAHEEISKHIKFSIQTNGTLITEDVAEYVKRGRLKIGVSIDGPKRIHDLHRVTKAGSGSYDSTMAGINVLKHVGAKYGIITTITEEFLKYMTPEEYVEWLTDVRPVSVKFGTFFPRGRGKEKQGLYGLFTRAAEFIISVFEMLEQKSERIGVANITRAIQNIVSPYKYMCMRAPCGAGEALLAVTPDGKVWACEEFTFDKDFELCESIETCTWDEIQKKRAYRLLQGFSTEHSPVCKICAFQLFCGGGCKSKAYYANGNIAIPYGCPMHKLIFKYVLTRMYHDGKEFLRFAVPKENLAKSIITLQY